MVSIIIPDQEKLDRIKAAIKEGGADKLHILADFDRTLTRAFNNGEEVPSIIYELRNGHYLTDDYASQADALFKKYHPIEIDHQISLIDKKRKMEEWWRAHFELLVHCSLNKSDLEKILSADAVELRGGALELLECLHKYKIPLVIISSTGLGGDIISMYLEKNRKLYDNIHIIANEFNWDENGNAVSVVEPIIHVANKDETIVTKMPFYSQIEKRRNVILLGDNLEDVGMIEGFDYNNLIKIGFLNKKIEEKLAHYKKNFDVVITNDGDMKYVNQLMREIIH